MRTAAIASVTLLLAGVCPALATGNLSCHFGDRNLKFGAEATYSYGVGEGFVSFGGTLEVLAKGAPDDLRTLDLDLPHLTQRWLYANDLKLRLYRERKDPAPHGYVELVIEAKQASKRNDEIDYRGTYVLTLYHLPDGRAEGKTVTLRGQARCSVG